MKNNKVKLGIIGLGARGYTLLPTILACDEVEITALCDGYEDRTEKARKEIETRAGYSPKKYSDYTQLINDENVQAVLISCSWDEHVHIAVECMEAKKIVALEVGGAYDIEDCWQLVRAYERTKTPVMCMENCCWDKFELLSTSLARSGKLGEIVHCHGAYCHDLREEVSCGEKNRHYRLINYIKRNCDNYPTHELGPIAKLLDINRGNKMVSLTSISTKAAGLKEYIKNQPDSDKKLLDVTFNQGDIVTTMIKCAGGETITLTLDTTLPRYYSREFTVHGTKGFCNQDTNIVYIDGEKGNEEIFETNKFVEKHLNNGDRFSKYLPSYWQNITKEETELGHGGMDYFMFKAFFKAILNNEEMPVDVYDAASWMSVTALTERSIANGGAVESIPDFTRGKWIKRPRLDVTEFPEIK